MTILPGWLFKTLSYRIDKEIKESLYTNDVFLSSQWGFLEKNVVLWSTHYKKYVLLTLFLSCLIITNFTLWQPWMKPYVINYIPHWRKLLEWQGAFLSGQLTIIGVVYPLVVGLVSVLLQNKSAKKVLFPMYQKYSGFMFAGLSGLALSGFIVAGYFFRAVIGDSLYAAVCLTSAMWLSSNLLLTSWFFVKTFRMLDESSRERLVFRFSIHEACELDIREKIKELLLQNAVQQKLLVYSDENVLEILTYKYSDNDYKEVARSIKRDKSLKDVNFLLLNIAILLQTIFLKLSNLKDGKLVIQPLRRSSTSKDMIIAKYYGFEINLLVKLLIQASFSFKKQELQGGIGLTTVLHGFIGPANDALRDSDGREFSDVVDTLALWHSEMAQALSFKNDEGEMDNWLLLPASGWGRSYLDELLGEYYRLAREAVERIPESSRFYRDMLYLHRRIFSRRDTLVRQEMRSLIQGSYLMWHLLIEWRSYASESADMRIANKYEDILYDFVGAWESWLTYIEPRSKQKRDVVKAYPAFITHLEFTASTAISALRFNNYEAAGWGVDMLNNWLENLLHDEYWNEEYRWRSVLLNHHTITIESDDPIWQVILKGNEYDYNAAFAIALKNTHLDLRIITACYMLIKPRAEFNELLTKYVKSLLSGARIHPTGALGRSSDNINSAGELLGAYIRHRDYRNYEVGLYGGWLSSIIDSFGRIYEERRISGRIYSGWGANDPRSMNRAYVEIALSLSERIWSLPNNWQEAVFSDAFRHMDLDSIISDLRDWKEIANEDHEYLLVDPEKQEELKANFIESIEGIIQKISEAQLESVSNSEVDQERLKGIGVTSSLIFSRKPHEFPLNLFENINLEADIPDESAYGVNIDNYAKEKIAIGIDTNRAINEDDWLSGCISADVKINILRALLKYPPLSTYEYSGLKNILADIKIMSESMACPVLFVGSQELSSALHRSLYERGLADEYDISRSDGYDNEYLCHIGRCEVYSLRFRDVDYSILTSKELFYQVDFKYITENQYVAVEFVLNEDSDTVGMLKLKYWMSVNLAENIRCIKLILDLNEDEGK